VGTCFDFRTNGHAKLIQRFLIWHRKIDGDIVKQFEDDIIAKMSRPKREYIPANKLLSLPARYA
jgi:hypothetical protein